MRGRRHQPERLAAVVRTLSSIESATRTTPNTGALNTVPKTLLAAILIAVLTATVACAPEPDAVRSAPTPSAEATALTARSTGSCLDADPPSPRPRDIAAHVYDIAVHSYLHTQVSSVGRALQGDEERKALALTDDAVYKLCVQGPENCLREQLAQASNQTEMLALLAAQGAYAYDRAIQCLIREGERYQGAGRPETYDERVATHLVGAVLPVGTLRETDYYGKAEPERLRRAEANWKRCYDLIAGMPVPSNSITERVDADLLTTTDCGDGATRRRESSEPSTNGTTRYATTVGG